MINFSEWETFPESVASSHANDIAISLTSKKVAFSYLTSSPEFKIKFGNCVIKYKVALASGGLTVGVMDSQRTKWLHANNYQQTSEGELSLNVPLYGATVRLVVAACNYSAGITTGKLLDVKVTQQAIFPYLITRLSQHLKHLEMMWHRWIIPFYYNLKIIMMAKWGRLIAMLSTILSTNSYHRYHVIDSQKGGYATRCITELPISASERYLVTADTGDDTLSIFPIKDGKLYPRRLLGLPKMSSPIYLSVVGAKSNQPWLAVSLFNFDYTGSDQQLTWLAGLYAADACRGNTKIADVESQMGVLLRREGYWGFRGSTVNFNDGDGFALAAADREASKLHVLKGNLNAGMQLESSESVDLGLGTEPIGVAGVEIKGQSGAVMYYLSCRLVTELVVVSSAPSGSLQVVERYQIGGLSRSSVAVGRFKPGGSAGLAFGLWGGDPRDLNATGIGKLVVCELREDGKIIGHKELEAGMNPTDVVVGDFDGDGIDEIAVLNYGNGLGPQDRQHTGNIQIFKFLDDSYQCISEINVPNPRIGAAIDIDGDGKQELVVSLFFEKRIVAIKCI